MPKTRRQDALDISPSLEVGCRTVGSWLLLATAGSGKEGRCHTGHAQPRPVAETGPRREARRRFTESRWDRGCAGREVPGRRPGATQLHRASGRPPGASVSPPDTGTLTSPFGVCPGCRLWLSMNHLQGHTLFHFSRHLRHGPHCPHLQTESWSAERRPCAAGTPPSEPKSP